MLGLLLIGLLAGLITGVSPCVLPVLPVLFFAGGAGSSGSPTSIPGLSHPAGGWRRPLAIIAGVVLSFSVVTLAGSTVLASLGLPADLLRNAGLLILLVVGLGLVFPPLEALLQAPFRRLPNAFRRIGGASRRNGFVLGLAVGTLYVPCAGPVLAAITVAGASATVNRSILALTAAFAVGVAIPLFFFALAGGSIGRRLAAYRSQARAFRIAGGVTMVVLTIALALNLTDGLQRSVPAYTQALQNRVENNDAARSALSAVRGAQSPTTPPTTEPPTTQPAPSASRQPAPAAPAPLALGPLVTCESQAPEIRNCGPANSFVGISAWLNVPGGKTPTIEALHGKVVIVDFWTFSCINCQRALPPLKAWYAAYKDSGLEVIGVHTPEFAFEREQGNVERAVKDLGITFPVGLDNSSRTWTNYSNQYWPAEYFVDADGIVRHVAFGEGGYAASERIIRELLRAADPSVRLPAPTDPAVPAVG